GGGLLVFAALEVRDAQHVELVGRELLGNLVVDRGERAAHFASGRRIELALVVLSGDLCALLMAFELERLDAKLEMRVLEAKPLVVVERARDGFDFALETVERMPDP